MALSKFLAAVRRAAGSLLSYPMSTLNGVQPISMSRWGQEAERSAATWLSPTVVEQYAEDDFAFLPSEQRDRLTEAVSEFRRMASEATTTADPELVRKAIPHLLLLMTHLGEFLGDADAEKVASVLTATRPQFPAYVHGAILRLGNDHSGDPAVWIWLILEDDVDIESRSVQEDLFRIRGVIRDQLVLAGVTRWPFISVRTRTEQTELLTRGAA